MSILVKCKECESWLDTSNFIIDTDGDIELEVSRCDCQDDRIKAEGKDEGYDVGFSEGERYGYGKAQEEGK
jgi:hypothetical protein